MAEPDYSAEEWRVIPGHEGHEVSSFGRVKNRKTGRILTPSPNSRYGHPCASKLGRIHRLVALAFLGPPPTPRHQIAHNDGVPTNNHVSNLRWATPFENSLDRIKHGRAAKKLTPEKVAEIRRRAAAGENRGVLASEFGVSRTTIWNIQCRRQWRPNPQKPMNLTR